MATVRPKGPIERTARFFLTDSGRDKLCRLIQYTLVMVLPFLREAGMLELAMQLDVVRSNMSFVRMAMRFEKPYPLFRCISRRHS